LRDVRKRHTCLPYLLLTLSTTWRRGRGSNSWGSAELWFAALSRPQDDIYIPAVAILP
jgi:hypothetical protein